MATFHFFFFLAASIGTTIEWGVAVCTQIENNPEQKKLQKTLALYFCISYRFKTKKTLELLVKKGTIEEI